MTLSPDGGRKLAAPAILPFRGIRGKLNPRVNYLLPLAKEEKDNKHEMEALIVDLQMGSRIRIVQRAKAAE